MTDPTHAEAAAMEAATPSPAEEPRYVWVISHREHAGDDAVMFHASTEAKAMEWLATEHKDPRAEKTGYYCLVKEPVDVRIEDGGICTLIGFYSLTGELLDDQPEVPGLVVAEDMRIIGRREDPLDAAVREFRNIWPGPEIQHFAARRLREHLAVAQKRRDQRELEIKAARRHIDSDEASQEALLTELTAILGWNPGEGVDDAAKRVVVERDQLRTALSHSEELAARLNAERDAARAEIRDLQEQLKTKTVLLTTTEATCDDLATQRNRREAELSRSEQCVTRMNAEIRDLQEQLKTKTVLLTTTEAACADLAAQRDRREAEIAEALQAATRLAQAIHRAEYQHTTPQWAPFDHLTGVISQIDNMHMGVVQRRDQIQTQLMAMNRAAGEVNDALGILDLCMVVPLVKDLQAKVDALTAEVDATVQKAEGLHAELREAKKEEQRLQGRLEEARFGWRKAKELAESLLKDLNVEAAPASGTPDDAEVQAMATILSEVRQGAAGPDAMDYAGANRLARNGFGRAPRPPEDGTLAKEKERAEKWRQEAFHLTSERDAAQAIIDATLKALPVGNIQTHTRESVPGRVVELVERYARETQIVEDLRDELNDIKAGVYPRRFTEWSEEDGGVIWWAVDSDGAISEPPHHLGDPRSSDWPYQASDEPNLLWVPLPKLASDRPLETKDT